MKRLIVALMLIAIIAGITPAQDITANTAVVLVMDVSDSMSGAPLAESKAAAQTFITDLDKSVSVALVTFATRVNVVQDFTLDHAQVIDSIAQLNLGGVTALYDGALKGIELAANAKAQNRIVVLLGDGAEYGGEGRPAASKSERDAALALARESGVTVYTIGLGFGADRTYLESLADAGSGKFYEAPTPSEVAAIYDSVSTEVAQNFIISTRGEQVVVPNVDAEKTALTDAPLLDTTKAAQEMMEISPLNNEIMALGLMPAPDTAFKTDTNGLAMTFGELSGALNSEVYPLNISVEGIEVLTATLEINGREVASFREAPFIYDLDAARLDEGFYTLKFNVQNTAGLISSDTFEVEVANVITETPLNPVQQVEDAADSANISAPVATTADTAATEQNPLTMRVVLFEGEIQPLNFVFNATEGLTFLPVTEETVGGNLFADLGAILAKPFELIPAPVRDTLTYQNPTLWSAVVLVMTFILLPQGLFTIYWMLYTWNNPEVAEKYSSPKEYTAPQYSFTALVPARKEALVIRETIHAVNNIDYPDALKEVLVLIRDEDDDETIEQAKLAISEIGKDNIKLVTFKDGPKNKPNGLNRGLKVATGDVVCIFDAEDTPHTELYNIVNTVMKRDGADVVQSGVQLMNFDSTWFSALNCLEYYFWFKSGLHCFTHNFKVTPLGGNTVFIKRDWLEKANGWDMYGLTEDADIGIRLTEMGAKIQIVYDERHATQEETPDTVDSFIKQRTRWMQGFYEIFFKGDWRRLPMLKQKITSIYILLNSLMQALTVIFLPLGLYIALTQRIAVPIAMLSFVPIFILLIQMMINLVGIREFTHAYNKRLPLFFRFKMILWYYPFQLLLALSAARAVRRYIRKQNAWEKTDHSNLHRQSAAAAHAK